MRCVDTGKGSRRCYFDNREEEMSNQQEENGRTPQPTFGQWLGAMKYAKTPQWQSKTFDGSCEQTIKPTAQSALQRAEDYLKRKGYSGRAASMMAPKLLEQLLIDECKAELAAAREKGESWANGKEAFNLRFDEKVKSLGLTMTSHGAVPNRTPQPTR